MNVDYIVIGSGLGGILFCEVLRQNNKSFVIFDDNSQQSSIVAGGLYNPVVLKRFTAVWRSKQQLDIALPMYHRLEQELGVKLDFKIPVYRLFNSIEEQNNWFTASDKIGLEGFLSTNIIKREHPAIISPFGFGEVLHTGRIDTGLLITAYKELLAQNNQLIKASFNYNDLTVKDSGMIYQDIEAKKIVFAEGYGLKKNPFFNYLPLTGTKGELLKIYAPKLKLDFVLKSSAFLIPMEEDHYLVGATYNWNDKTNETTPEAKQQLVDKLETFINCEYQIVDQVAGMRPTVIDRRPLIGMHNQLKHMYVLNGLGTRGVMIAPYVAKQLFNFIENGKDLDKEIDIKRFDVP